MSYQVGVDLGTTYSAVAVGRPDGPIELVSLGQRARSVPSTVYAGPDGALLIGEAAERRALSDPARVVREFKRRIGDPTPVLVGRDPVPAEQLAARFISRLLQDVAGRRGGVASRVAVTHPAGWGPHRLESLRGALAEHGLGSAVLLTEPQAAAIGYADTERVDPGTTVAVYDLGGGTFDAAVVRKTAGGGFELLGTPEGLDQLGGVDFDEVVFAHVRAALGAEWAALDASDPEVLAAVAGLRRECTAAKEALSHDTEVLISVLLPGLCTQVRLGRAEFEDMIRPAVAETVAALRRALESAAVTAADLGALLLVGGSSRIPLITQAVSAEFGRSAAVDVDPKGVIAAGAAVVARAAERGSAAPAGVAGPDRPGAPPAPAGAEAPRPAEAADGSSSEPSGVPATAGSAPSSGPGSPAPRPPKQARPFAAVVEQPERRRRVGVGVAAGALVLVVLGAAVAFGANRIGADQEAGATTPTTQVPAVSPVATVEPPAVTPPSEPPPAPARTRSRPPTARGAAPPPPPPATTTAPPAATTTAPAPGNDQDLDNGPAPDPGAEQGGAGGDGGTTRTGPTSRTPTRKPGTSRAEPGRRMPPRSHPGRPGPPSHRPVPRTPRPKRPAPPASRADPPVTGRRGPAALPTG